MDDDNKKKLDETETPEEPKTDGTEGDASPETMAPVQEPETTTEKDA
ncbi:hypothetical protein K8Q93_03205 [Candidatus Parcubacteria bacterium]|nr:hypothetical protein [Candidatus Parcubacteria bacterium]